MGYYQLKLLCSVFSDGLVRIKVSSKSRIKVSSKKQHLQTSELPTCEGLESAPVCSKVDFLSVTERLSCPNTYKINQVLLCPYKRQFCRHSAGFLLICISDLIALYKYL